MQTEKKIIVIEQNAVPLSSNLDGIVKKKKVCAYARVSTDLEQQMHSYETQINEFTNFIKSRSDWEFVKMYSDEGISGTSLKNRKGFLEMINDARNGKIDLILTKSLSRFARNTVDALTIIREMRNIGVDIFFEKENIYSSDAKVDFMLTIFSSIAQEEARNISENVKWGVRKRFKEGKVFMNTATFLGYKKDKSGNLVIDEEQANTIKVIYNLYLANYSVKQIRDYLIKNNYKNGRGLQNWSISNIHSILKNEKYCGDAILQKTIVVDYLTHKTKKNDGIVDKYYVKDNHPPIIERHTWNLVQTLLKTKNESYDKFYNYRTSRYPLSSKVYCGECKRHLHRSKFMVNKNTSRIALTCKKRSNLSNITCSALPIDNETLELAIIDAMKEYSKGINDFASELLSIIQSTASFNDVACEIASLKEEIINYENNLKQLVRLKLDGNTSLSDDELNKNYIETKSKLDKSIEMLDNLNKKLTKTHTAKTRIEEIKSELQNEQNLDKLKFFAYYISRIIKISAEDIVICVEINKVEEPEFLNSFEEIKNYPPIIEDVYFNQNSGRMIKYKIVAIGGHDE